MNKIELNNGKSMYWENISEKNPPILPSGSKMELTLVFDEKEFLEGKNGIVWATYNLRQAEIIQNTLLAQNINAEIKKDHNSEYQIYKIIIMNKSDVNEAINFIWKSKSGLKLLPDWNYKVNEKNSSFEQWLGER